MVCSRTLFRKNYVIFVGLLILLVASMLSWIAYARLASFHQHHLDIAHESVSGVEKQVAFYIAEKQRMVEVFAEEKIDSLRALALNSDNDELHEHLGELLSHYFPDRFAFSIADNAGEPRFEDFDGLIGDRCLSDLKHFSEGTENYRPYIHPNAENYHFDIMVLYGKDGKEGVFFVSFLANVLGDIINSIQGPGHQIMLVLPDRDNLIEVVAEGARNHWTRDDYRLTEQELARIFMRHDIAGTRWQAIDFHNEQLHTNYRNELIIDSSATFLVFFVIAALLIIRLQREERQRELAEEQKQILMSVVSHEFRSPVAIIKSALDLINEGDAGEINADVKKYIGMASSSTARLLYLVDDFLDIQKIESGGLSFHQQKSQLSTVVSDAVRHNKLYAEKFSARYKLIEPLTDDIVLCDKHRIEQVLTNFLSNAAKYGGEQDIIGVAVTRLDERLRVSVTDHGPGIPKEFQPQVFEKFAMAQVPQKKRPSGQKVNSSGLGLSIAKSIIEQHGGRIGFDTITGPQANPSAGTGTTFWFELPTL